MLKGGLMAESTNVKLMARVPIVPDDFVNQSEHKVHEVVMDFGNADIYVKVDETNYVNITGAMKEAITEIQDGSTIIHIVTESTLPPVADRKENHWYYVVLNSEIDDETVEIPYYIYYGLSSDYSVDKNYLLVGMNMFEGTDTIAVNIVEGYHATFYVPTNMDVTFTDVTTAAESIVAVETDRLYGIDTVTGQIVPYSVYLLRTDETGERLIRVSVDENNYYIISFDSNQTALEIEYPAENLKVVQGNTIGTIPDPVWNAPRYIFKGWSFSKTNFEPVSSSYVPNMDTTIYAYFDYNNDPTLATYYAEYTSEGGGD